MASTFFERIDYLAQQVGEGTLTGKDKVDQAYAHYIHEGISRFTGRPLIFHEGGRAEYLRRPFFEKMDRHMETLALHAITPDGSELKSAMIDVVEEISIDVFVHAPREFGDLRASASPRVIDNGEEVYHRPPNVHRLSEDELRAKDHVRSLFTFDRRPGGRR